MAEVSQKLISWWQDKISINAYGKTQSERAIPESVLHLLRIRREHRLLLVTLAGSKNRYQSMLLEVDLAQDRLLLDVPFPQEHPIEFWLGRRVNVATIEAGINTQFESQVLSIDSLHQSQVLSLAMPREVMAAQRRRNFRLVVDDHTAVDAVLKVAGVGNLAAKVLDLSVAGIRFSLAGSYSKLDKSKLCLRLGLDSTVVCSLSICSLQQLDDGPETTVIGAEFVGLHPEQVRNIQRFLARSQRLQRQRELEMGPKD